MSYNHLFLGRALVADLRRTWDRNPIDTPARRGESAQSAFDRLGVRNRRVPYRTLQLALPAQRPSMPE